MLGRLETDDLGKVTWTAWDLLVCIMFIDIIPQRYIVARPASSEKAIM